MKRSLTWPLAVLGLACLVGAGCAEGLNGPGQDDASGGGGSDDDDSDGGASDGGASDGGTTADGGSPSTGGAPPDPCGNGAIDPNEDCDGENLDGASCMTLDFAGGDLACNADCTFDSSACVEMICNNGVLEVNEVCDGTNLDGHTCASEGFVSGTLTCTTDTCVFDTTGCITPLAEGFEGGSIPTGFSTSGSANWFVDTVNIHTGTRSARSGDISDSQTTSLFVTVQFDAAGTVSFWHLESSESSFDYLEFYIDGIQQNRWSGANAWAEATFAAAIGTHTLEWRYRKDGSVSTGSDAVWVDDISAVNGHLP